MPDQYCPSLPTPLTLLAPDQSTTIQSDSSSSSYTVKRIDNHYSCTCPSWRLNNKGVAPDRRSCKHIRGLVGNAYEDARLGVSSGAAGGKGTGGAGGGKRGYATKAGATADDKDKDGGKSKRKRSDSPSATPSTSNMDGGTTVKRAKNGSAGGAPDKITLEVLLAKKFELDGKKDPKGYWVSEKLDGIRAFWDGKALYSRVGNKFHAPAWFTNKLPKDHQLDGELFHSRNTFSAATSIVRSHASEKWGELRYKVFDIPSLSHLPFESRLASLAKIFPDPVAPPQAPNTRIKGPIVDLVEHTECGGLDELVMMLKEVEEEGGEGLMLREPKSLYVGKRSGTLLKVKTFFDAEARVTGYEPGKGKYKNQTGSLICEMESGKTFSVGSGLTDAQRVKPPPVGSIITYRFQEVTKDLVPRFPTFVGERIDATGPKDADVTRKGGAVGRKVDGEDQSD